MDNLYDLVQNSQQGDEESTLEIIKRFYPLIKKYSRKLDYDGADTDLVISLIETIYRMPVSGNSDMKNEGCIIGYINVSIKNKYIYFSKKYHPIKLETELTPNILVDSFDETIDSQIFLCKILDNLPHIQKKVLEELFIKNKSVSQIAMQLNISRQAVNKAKNRALKNLRNKNIV